MKLKFPRTNIESQLLKNRNRIISEEQLLEEVQKIFDRSEENDQRIKDTLAEGNASNNNDFKLENLESSRIYHLDHIHKICVDYRLRFLDTKFFKGDIPYEALQKIKEIESKNDTKLSGFKIVAPSKLFKLENADDPLLFAPIGNDYYYLIHKWGNDLHPFRKLLMWPFKTLENFAIFLLAVSFLTACLLPENLFTPHQTTTQFLLIFFFIFKWFAGLSIFYGFKKGKNFSTEIWNSKFYNA